MQLDKATINTLAKKREVPYEVMFKLSDAKQDPIKKNRYWFDFPGQWVNQLDKDAIIGIRDIYLTKTNRLAYFKLTISLREDNLVLLKRYSNRLDNFNNHEQITNIIEEVTTLVKKLRKNGSKRLKTYL